MTARLARDLQRFVKTAMCFTVVRSGFLHFSIQLSHRHCSISVRDSIQLSSLSSTWWTSTDSSPSFPYLPSTCLAICMPVDFISNVGSFESYPRGYKTHTHNPTPAYSHLHWLLLAYRVVLMGPSKKRRKHREQKADHLGLRGCGVADTCA